MKLYLVRHGQTDANQQKVFQGWLDMSLNQQGRQEADWLREQLGNREFLSIYTSPLQRAVETARIIFDGRTDQVPLEVVPALKEMNFGKWDGLTSEQITQRCPEAYQSWLNDWQEVAPPNGESAKAMFRRVTTWLDQVTGEDVDQDGDLLIISHEGVLLQIIAHLLGLELADCWRFRVSPGSLSILEIRGGYGSLIGLNYRLKLELERESK